MFWETLGFCRNYSKISWNLSAFLQNIEENYNKYIVVFKKKFIEVSHKKYYCLVFHGLEKLRKTLTYIYILFLQTIFIF